jgi:hypothetical protein
VVRPFSRLGQPSRIPRGAEDLNPWMVARHVVIFPALLPPIKIADGEGSPTGDVPKRLLQRRASSTGPCGLSDLRGGPFLGVCHQFTLSLH